MAFVNYFTEYLFHWSIILKPVCHVTMEIKQSHCKHLRNTLKFNTNCIFRGTTDHDIKI